MIEEYDGEEQDSACTMCGLPFYADDSHSTLCKACNELTSQRWDGGTGYEEAREGFRSDEDGVIIPDDEEPYRIPFVDFQREKRRKNKGRRGQ